MYYLFNDDACEYVANNKNEIIELLKEQHTETTETNIFNFAADEINYNFEEVKTIIKNFDKQNENNKIIVVASLGLWYGRRAGSAKIDTLQAALFGLFEDVNALYFKNKKSTLTLRATHHDGENFFRFYKLIHGKKYAITQAELLRGL